MPDEWTTPAPQAETGQFFRGFSHTQPKEFITSLEEQSCNFRPSGVLFKHRVSPEKIQFPACFFTPILSSLRGFSTICLSLNELCYLLLPFEYALPFP